jgi:hypothetical protein
MILFFSLIFILLIILIVGCFSNRGNNLINGGLININGGGKKKKKKARKKKKKKKKKGRSKGSSGSPATAQLGNPLPDPSSNKNPSDMSDDEFKDAVAAYFNENGVQIVYEYLFSILVKRCNKNDSNVMNLILEEYKKYVNGKDEDSDILESAKKMIKEEIKTKLNNISINLNDKGIEQLLLDMLSINSIDKIYYDALKSLLFHVNNSIIEVYNINVSKYNQYIISENNQWECGHCTLLNDNSVKVCAVCGKSQDTKPEDPPKPIESWVCNNCDLNNMNNNHECDFCGLLKQQPPINFPVIPMESIYKTIDGELKFDFSVIKIEPPKIKSSETKQVYCTYKISDGTNEEIKFVLINTYFCDNFTNIIDENYNLRLNYINSLANDNIYIPILKRKFNGYGWGIVDPRGDGLCIIYSILLGTNIKTLVGEISNNRLLSIFFNDLILEYFKLPTAEEEQFVAAGDCVFMLKKNDDTIIDITSEKTATIQYLIENLLNMNFGSMEGLPGMLCRILNITMISLSIIKPTPDDILYQDDNFSFLNYKKHKQNMATSKDFNSILQVKIYPDEKLNIDNINENNILIVLNKDHTMLIDCVNKKKYVDMAKDIIKNRNNAFSLLDEEILGLNNRNKDIFIDEIVSKIHKFYIKEENDNTIKEVTSNEGSSVFYYYLVKNGENKIPNIEFYIKKITDSKFDIVSDAELIIKLKKIITQSPNYNNLIENLFNFIYKKNILKFKLSNLFNI